MKIVRIPPSPEFRLEVTRQELAYLLAAVGTCHTAGVRESADYDVGEVRGETLYEPMKAMFK